MPLKELIEKYELLDSQEQSIEAHEILKELKELQTYNCPKCGYTDLIG